MIPLPPNEIERMWSLVKEYDFKSTHGAFRGMDIYHEDVKKRVLESMQIQVKAEGHENHAFLKETV